MRTLWGVAVLLLAAFAAALPAGEPAQEVPVAPAEVIAACADDVRAVDPERARTTRWVSLHNLPAAERDRAAKTIAGHLHHLSREPDLLPLVAAKDYRVGDAAILRVGEWLIRIDTLDFGKLFARKWEELGAVEPYFHADLEEPQEEYEDAEVEYGYWVRPDGTARAGSKKFDDETWVKTRVVKERRKKQGAVKLKRGLAPWLAEDERGKAALEVLQAKTGGTDVPVVTAEWLLQQTAIQFKRAPVGYYDFTGVKNQQTFEAAVGFVRKELDPGFLKELREAVANSTVTTPDTLRRVVRLQAAGGGYWFTQDSNLRLAKVAAKANPIANLGDDYEFQGVEAYGVLPNGFWLTAALNNQGATVDVVPPEIASDSTAPHSDRQVHPNLSCLRCHTDGGLQDVSGWVRNVLNAPPNYLAVADPKVARELRQQYVTRRLEPFLKRDRDQYAAALWEVTGLKPAEYAGGYGSLWNYAAEEPVTMARAARDLGTTPKLFRESLEKLGPKADPMLAGFRQDRPQPIPVVTWLKSYQNAQDALRGVARNVGVLKAEKK